jgi:hypothetical protein
MHQGPPHCYRHHQLTSLSFVVIQEKVGKAMQVRTSFCDNSEYKSLVGLNFAFNVKRTNEWMKYRGEQG